MEHVERIGPYRVIGIENIGGFVVKTLESAMDVEPLEPGSDAAKEIARSMRKSDDARRKTQRESGKNKNRPIKTEPRTGWINNI